MSSYFQICEIVEFDTQIENKKLSMLTDTHDEPFLKRMKRHLFITQMSLLNNASFTIPLPIKFVLTILSVILNISIFISKEPFNPQIVNEIFLAFDIHRLQESLGLSQQFFMVIVNGVNILILILTILLFKDQISTSLCIKTLYALLSFKVFLNGPLTKYQMENAQFIFEQNTPLMAFLHVFWLIVNILTTVIAICYVGLKIQPFRNKSINWNISNQPQLFSFILNITKICIIVFDDLTTSLLIISLVSELYLGCVEGGPLERRRQILHKFSNRLNKVILISLIFERVTQDDELSTNLLLFLLIITLVKLLIDFVYAADYAKYIPLCKRNTSQFYNFYFEYKEERAKGKGQSSGSQDVKSRKDNSQEEIIKVHLLNCLPNDRCRIQGQKLQEETFLEDLQTLIHKSIVERSQNSMDDEFLTQLWNYETGSKHQFRMSEKKLPLNLEFIIYIVLNNSKFNQSADTVNAENVKLLKNVFYEKMQNCLMCFSIFYEEISKSHPKLYTILQVGNEARQCFTELKVLYQDLLKNHAINFKTAEVYIEFQSYFSKTCDSKGDCLEKLQNIQKNRDPEDIEELYVPALSSYCQTGLIENMNAECLSFFRLSRFQIKSKNVMTLMRPAVPSMKEVKTRLKELKQTKMPVFFVRGEEQIIFGAISIKEKYQNNRKFDFLSVEKQAHSDFKNVILVNKKSCVLECMLKEESFIRPNLNFHSNLLLKWPYIYNNYICPRLSELLEQRILKVKIQEYENSLFVVSAEETIQPDYCILSIKFIKDAEKKKNRVSSFMLNKPQLHVNQRRPGKFQFYYEAHEDDLLLYGVSNQAFRFRGSLNKSKSLGRLERSLNNLLIASTVLREDRYSKGIKTYRLYEKQLYNVDLEDKEKYVEQFEEEFFSKLKDSRQTHGDDNYLFLLAGVILMCVAMSSVAIIFTGMIEQSYSVMEPALQNALNIEKLSIYMNRLIGVTRDVQKSHFGYSLYESRNRDYKEDVLETYAWIKNLREDNFLFSNKEFSMDYNLSFESRVMNGTMNEILDILLANVFFMTQEPDPADSIEFLHQSYIGEIQVLIQGEAYSNFDSIAFETDHLMDIELIVTVSLILMAAVFYILFILLIAMLNEQAKVRLNRLMMMSDGEAREKTAVAEKLKYAIDMVNKGFDLDLKGLIGSKESHKQRTKPKVVVVGSQKKVVIAVLIIVGFSVNLTAMLLLESHLKETLTTVKSLWLDSINIVDAYSGFVEETNLIGHYDVFSLKKIELLRSNLIYLTSRRSQYNFDAETNELIDDLLYENSCPILNYMDFFATERYQCDQTLPYSIVKNPFELGLVAYFSRAHYQILDNIKDTYSITGIDSRPMVRLFSLLIEKMIQSSQTFMADGFGSFSQYRTILIVTNILYLVFAIATTMYLKNTIRKIDELLTFIDNNQKGKDSSKTPKKGFGKEKSSSSSINQNIRKSQKSVSIKGVTNENAQVPEILSSG